MSPDLSSSFVPGQKILECGANGNVLMGTFATPLFSVTLDGKMDRDRTKYLTLLGVFKSSST